MQPVARPQGKAMLGCWLHLMQDMRHHAVRMPKNLCFCFKKNLTIDYNICYLYFEPIFGRSEVVICRKASLGIATWIAIFWILFDFLGIHGMLTFVWMSMIV